MHIKEHCEPREIEVPILLFALAGKFPFGWVSASVQPQATDQAQINKTRHCLPSTVKVIHPQTVTNNLCILLIKRVRFTSQCNSQKVIHTTETRETSEKLETTITTRNNIR